MRVRLSMLGWMFTAGCAIDAEKWDEKLAKAECDYAKRCDEAAFWYTWEDEGACRDDKLSEVADTAGCTFDADSAKACLDALDASCKTIGREYDALIAPCFAVWTCPGGDSADTGAP